MREAGREARLDSHSILSTLVPRPFLFIFCIVFSAIMHFLV